jgi:hypothetical protein
MKKIVTFVFLVCFSVMKAQEDPSNTVIIDDLKTPDSPGFQLLDISPSTITRPQNPKEFAVSALSLSQNGSALPQNFAMEFNPLLLFKKYDGIYKYYNVKHDNENNYASGMLRKLTLSLASTVLDSVKTGIKGETNYMAFGVRTNLLTIRSVKQNLQFKEDLNLYTKAVEKLMSEEVNTEVFDGLLGEKELAHDKLEKEYESEPLAEKRILIQKDIDKIKNEIKEIDDAIKLLATNKIEDLGKAMDNHEDVKKFYKTLEEAPLFQLDAAFAYSEAYPDNSYDKRRFNRNGAWLTAIFNFKGLDELSTSDTFSLLFTSRYLQDNVLEDPTLLTFKREKAFDLGVKFEYAFEKLTIGVEHLQRSYTNDSIGNSKRTVGNLQYEISKNLYFTGSYGHNFGDTKPLFALFGINFGLGKAKFKKEEE